VIPVLPTLDLLNPDLALGHVKEAGFLDALKAVWREAQPWQKGLAAGGAVMAAYPLATKPVQNFLIEKMREDVPIAETEKPIPIKKDQHGADILPWIQKFKKEHPEVKQVPVYASGKVPVSMYLSEVAFKNPGQKKLLKEEWGVTKPGVYLRELSAPVALHEMGHASMNEKVPGISLLTHGISALSLPLLAYSIFKKPGSMKFIEKWSPAISAALQVPALAEEAGASIMAEKTLKREGESGKKIFGPAWLTYAVQAGLFPAAQAAVKYVKRV